jgi:chromosome segregation ATPase
VSARAAAARRESPLSNTADSDQDARAEAVAALDDLKERLSKAETIADQYRKQTEVLQTRLEDAQKESAKMEEKVHEGDEQLEILRNEKRETARQMREMETIYEAERSAMLKDKEEMANREEEMQTVIQRLKDSLSQRNNGEDDVRASRQGEFPVELIRPMNNC